MLDYIQFIYTIIYRYIDYCLYKCFGNGYAVVHEICSGSKFPHETLLKIWISKSFIYFPKKMWKKV